MEEEDKRRKMDLENLKKLLIKKNELSQRIPQKNKCEGKTA